jgi:hypothetical protein
MSVPLSFVLGLNPKSETRNPNQTAKKNEENPKLRFAVSDLPLDSGF